MESFKEQPILVKDSGMRILGSHYFMGQEGQEKELFNGACRELKALEMGPSDGLHLQTLLYYFLSPA